MPLYEYHCHACGVFEVSNAMAQRQFPQNCPICNMSSPRIISAPQLNTMSATLRKAHRTNEHSAHAPRLNNSNCCSGNICSRHTSNSKPSPKEGEARPFKVQTGVRRPWQISH